MAWTTPKNQPCAGLYGQYGRWTWWNIQSAHGGEFAKAATAWYLWQLKGDNAAGKMFTGDPSGLAKNPQWKVEKKNMP